MSILSELISSNPMEKVSELDKEFINNIKDDLAYPLENHQVFIASMYDLIERTQQKIDDLKLYESYLSVKSSKAQEYEYEYFNKKCAIEDQLKKAFSTHPSYKNIDDSNFDVYAHNIKINFDLLKEYTHIMTQKIQEDFVHRQVRLSTSCEFSFGKPRQVWELDKSVLSGSKSSTEEQYQGKTKSMNNLLIIRYS